MNFKTISIILLTLSMLSACRLKNANDTESSTNQTDTFNYKLKDTLAVSPPTERQPDSSLNEKVLTFKLPVDSQLTAAAQLIAGLQTAESFSEPKEKYHEIHRGMINQIWRKIDQTYLQPITNWRDENNINEAGDTTTLFYPFSGPDFLYAHTFFPNCKNYILIGLENAGTLPDFRKMSDKDFDAYFERLRLSLNYFNKVGYFTTNQMRNDFSKNEFNGTVHLLLLYIAKTNHSIIDVSPVYIDSYGNPQTKKENAKSIQGIRIEYTTPEAKRKQSVYYFEFNLSNENMNLNTEFITFLSRFNEKITYLKSASYILHNSNFSELRNVIINQSAKILQDDSGIPYALLKGSKRFDINLYGTYTKTIKEFKGHFQSELKKELDQQGNPKLGFTLGYNSWHGETILMFAKAKDAGIQTQQIANLDTTNRQKTPDKTGTKQKDTGVLYKVQFLMSYEVLPSNSQEFKGLKDVESYKDNKIFKYTTGNEAEQKSCDKWLKLARDKGFKDAFVVAFHNNSRISLNEAQKLTSKINN